jgi:hypothetical protein
MPSCSDIETTRGIKGTQPYLNGSISQLQYNKKKLVLATLPPVEPTFHLHITFFSNYLWSMGLLYTCPKIDFALQMTTSEAA